jgi:mannose-6-phosphate isomerase-like protein (cupin superfamily)
MPKQFTGKPVQMKTTATCEDKLVLRNHFNGETFVFDKDNVDPDTSRFDVILQADVSGGGNALAHIHPAASETFTVKSGRLAVVMNGVATLAEPGQSVTIPAGTPHYFKNAIQGQTQATVAFSPAQQHLRFFQNFAMLTETKPQWFSAKGDAPLLLMALVLHRYRDHLYLAGIPVLIQKALFGFLSLFARIRGYRLAIEPKPAERIVALTPGDLESVYHDARL